MGGTHSVLEVRPSILSEPIVGRDVTMRIEILSGALDLSNAKLNVTLPAGVELVSGDADWVGNIPANSSAIVELVIRVIQSGEWKISVAVGVVHDTQNSSADWETFYVVSSTTSASAVEDTSLIDTPIPTLQILPVSESINLANPIVIGTNSVGGTLTVSGQISFTATLLSPDPANPLGYLVSSKIQPLRRVRVEAWDEKLSQPGTYTFLTVRTLTTSTGNYILSLTNVDPDGDGTGG